MTNEEAIKKLQRHKAEYLDKWVDFSGITEALDMAIKALEQKSMFDKAEKTEEIYQKMEELSVRYANKGLTINFEFDRFGMILRGYLDILDIALNPVNIYCYNRLYTYEFMRSISDTLDLEMLVDNFKEEVFEHYRMEKMTRKEYDKLIRLMHNASLQNVDTGRLDGKEEDVIPLEDAITIIRKVYAEREEE